MPPIQARGDQGVMTMKGFSAFTNIDDWFMIRSACAMQMKFYTMTHFDSGDASD